MTKFEWIIKNFDMRPVLSAEYINSPPFCLEEAKGFGFCLKLFLKDGNGESAADDVPNLKLCRCDDIEEDVKFDYDLNISNKWNHNDTRECETRKSHIQSLGLHKEQSLYIFRNGVGIFLHVTFTVLNFGHDDTENEITHLEDLSSAYARLLEIGTFSDFSVKIGSQDFNVHKAILEARSEAVAKTLYEINSHQGGHDTAYPNLFRFLYTGKFECLNVADDLYILLKKLDRSLLTYLKRTNSDTTVAVTSVEVKQFAFQWTIENFEDLKPNEKVFNIVTEGPAWCWLRFIFTVNQDEDGNLLLEVHRLHHDVNIFFRCNVCIVQNDEDITEVYDSEHLFQTEADWQLPIDFKNKFLHEERDVLLKNGTLTLHFEHDISRGEYSTTVRRNNFSRYLSHIKNLHHLSKNFEKLFENPKHYDFTIKASEIEFKVHKAILSARSPVFYSMFHHDTVESQNAEVTIEDITAEAVSSMLCYIYCGKLKYLDFDLAIDLYRSADKYQIGMLKQKCSTFLKSSLSSKTAAIIMQVADTHGDLDLKTCVWSFVSSNTADVLKSEKWKNMVNVQFHGDPGVWETFFGFGAGQD